MSFRLECDKEGETDNAIQVYDHVSGELLWFPLSTVESMHFDGRNKGYIIVADWIARRKNLI